MESATESKLPETSLLKSKFFRVYVFLCFLVAIVGSILLYPRWLAYRYVKQGDELYADEGTRAKALELYKKALKWKREDEHLLRYFISLDLRGDSALISRLKDHVGTKEKRTVREDVFFASALFEEGRIDEAAAIVNAVLSENPDNKELQLLAARLALRRDDRKNALRLFRKVFKLQKENPLVLESLAGLLLDSSSVMDKIFAKAHLIKLVRKGELKDAGLLLILLTDSKVPTFPMDNILLFNHLIEGAQGDELIRGLSEKDALSLVQKVTSLKAGNRIKFLQAMLERESDSDEGIRQVVRMGIAFGEYKKLIPYLQKVLERKPANRMAELFLARCQLREPQNVSEALAIMRKRLLEDSDDAQALNLAMHVIADSKSALADEDVLELIELVKNHTHAAFAQRLQVTETQLQLQPEGKERVLNELIAKTSEEDLLKLIPWLARREKDDVILQICTEARCTKSLGYLEGRFHSLARLKRFDEADSLLKDSPIEIPVETKDLWLCRRFMVEKNYEEAKGYLHKLFEGEMESLEKGSKLVLARIASILGESEIAFKLFQDIDVGGGAQMQPRDWMFYLGAAMKLKHFERCYGIARSAYFQYPRSGVFINNFAYFNILRSDRIEEFTKQAEKLASANPKVREYQLTVALGYFRLKQFEKALEFIRSINVKGGNFSHSEQAIYAAILGANGKSRMAREIARGIDRSELFPLERNLIEVLD